ncbi:hypothetical protein F4825DRAFT_476394 [Nemania diffusa]|nr:hypothetical protein F4825DRAFT_476394 [Nemania diffusa]
MEASKTSDLCIICDKPDALRCGWCKGTSYCSKICQRGDYPIHKLLCATFSRFDMTKRPTKKHVRAILFPPDQKIPNLIWLDCEPGYPIAKSFLNGERGVASQIDFNEILAKSLSNPVRVRYRDNFSHDGSVLNNSISVITHTVPGKHLDWRGPIVAYGVAKPSPGVEDYYRDVDMNDFRHIADYFISYASDRTTCLSVMLPATANRVRGVRINCDGDQWMFNKPHFEEIELGAMHDIFVEHDTSDIADRINLPIFTKRCFPHPNWAALYPFLPMYDNEDATYLHLCCDPKVKRDRSRRILGWGRASEDWQKEVGSIIVVRHDKKPISRWHVEALCGYCRYEIKPYLGHSNGEFSPDEPMSRDLVLSMICRPTFSIYWSKMCSEKLKNGEEIYTQSPWRI